MTPSAAKASPVNPVSSPAMILRSELLPEPFSPSTPILAPGRNESQMSRSTTASGGCARPRPFIV